GSLHHPLAINAPAPTDTYTLSLHDALPISVPAEYGELPSKALAAIDFTSYSLDAARTAATFLEPGGQLHLVHAIAKESGVALPSDRKSTRLNSSHVKISYAVFCLKKKQTTT